MSQGDPMLPVRMLLARFLFGLGLTVSVATYLLGTLLLHTLNQINAPAVGVVLLIVSVTGMAFACVCGPIWAAWVLRQRISQRRARRQGVGRAAASGSPQASAGPRR